MSKQIKEIQGYWGIIYYWGGRKGGIGFRESEIVYSDRKEVVEYALRYGVRFAQLQYGKDSIETSITNGIVSQGDMRKDVYGYFMELQDDTLLLLHRAKMVEVGGVQKWEFYDAQTELILEIKRLSQQVMQYQENIKLIVIYFAGALIVVMLLRLLTAMFA